MKKITSLILVVCMCISLGVMFTACNNSNADPSEPSVPVVAQSGWLLPVRLAASDNTAFDLVWGENSCTFTVEGTTYTFTYNPEKRSLSISVDGGMDYNYEDLCVFDADDRISAINFENRSVLEMVYAEDKITVSAFGAGDLSEPVEISADWNEHKVSMPPFNNPEDFLYFTEWGDLYAGEGTTLYNYQYDAKGNIQSVTMSDFGDYSWSLSYGEEVMTKAWQRTVIKFLLVWTIGRPMSVFAMDMMCFGLYQQHNEK